MDRFQPVPEIDVSAVIKRIKGALRVKTDSDLAQLMCVSNKTISSWRSRNSIPIETVIGASRYCRKSIDFLLFGRDREASETDFNLDKDIMEIVGEVVFSLLLREHAYDKYITTESSAIAEEGGVVGRFISHVYETIAKDKIALVDQAGLSIEKFWEYQRKREYFGQPFMNDHRDIKGRMNTNRETS